MTVISGNWWQGAGRRDIPKDDAPAPPAAERPTFEHSPMRGLRSELDELEFKKTSHAYTLGQNEAWLESLQRRRRAAEELLKAASSGDEREDKSDRERAEKALASLAEPIKKAEEAVAVHKRRLAETEAQIVYFNEHYRGQMEKEEAREKLRRQVPR